MSTLDPALEKLLADLKAQGLPNYWKTTAAEARKITEDPKMVEIFNGKPEPIYAVEDREVPGPGGPLRLRFYTPKKVTPPETMPTLLFFHGGGVPVEFSCYEDMNRGFLSMGKIASGAKRAIHQCATFLREV